MNADDEYGCYCFEDDEMDVIVVVVVAVVRYCRHLHSAWILPKKVEKKENAPLPSNPQTPFFSLSLSRTIIHNNHQPSTNNS
jgi:hypothetical protein